MLRRVALRIGLIAAPASAIAALALGVPPATTAADPTSTRSAATTPVSTPPATTAPDANAKLVGPTTALVPHGDGVLAIGHQDLASDALTATAVDAAGARSAPTTLQKVGIIDVVTATGGERLGVLWTEGERQVTRLRFAEWHGSDLVLNATLARTKTAEYEGLALVLTPDGGAAAAWTTVVGRDYPYRYQPWVAVQPPGSAVFRKPAALDRPRAGYNAADVSVDMAPGGAGVVRAASTISAGFGKATESIVRRIEPSGGLSAPIRGLLPASRRGEATMRVAAGPSGEIVAVDEAVDRGRYRVRATRLPAGALRAHRWTPLISQRVRGAAVPQVVATATPEIAIDAAGRVVAVVPASPTGLAVIDAEPGVAFRIAATLPELQAFDPLLLARADGWPTLIASRRPAELDGAPSALVGLERSPSGAWLESGSVPLDTRGRPAGIADAVRIADGRVAVAVNAVADDDVLTDGYLVFGSLATLAGPP